MRSSLIQTDQWWCILAWKLCWTRGPLSATWNCWSVHGHSGTLPAWWQHLDYACTQLFLKTWTYRLDWCTLWSFVFVVSNAHGMYQPLTQTVDPQPPQSGHWSTMNFSPVVAVHDPDTWHELLSVCERWWWSMHRHYGAVELALKSLLTFAMIDFRVMQRMRRPQSLVPTAQMRTLLSLRMSLCTRSTMPMWWWGSSRGSSSLPLLRVRPVRCDVLHWICTVSRTCLCDEKDELIRSLFVKAWEGWG